MSIALTPEVLNVLEASRVEGLALFLPPARLDRKLYEQVNQALEALGGKWNRKTQGHLFGSDPAELVEQAILTGEVTNRKQELQFFETPAALAARLVELADIGPGMQVLEPSAGRGAIAGAILAAAPTVCLTLVELDARNREALLERFPMDRFPIMDAFCQDFLGTVPFPRFDRVVMNPPFSRQQDIAHILHAWEWLRPGGILVSVMSPSFTFRENRKTVEFRAWLEAEGGEVFPLAAESFRESGTDVSAVVVRVRKGGAE